MIRKRTAHHIDHVRLHELYDPIVERGPRSVIVRAPRIRGGAGAGDPEQAGADAIKFQNYTAGKLATRVAPRYWVEADDPNGSQWDTFDRLDKLPEEELMAHRGW